MSKLNTVVLTAIVAFPIGALTATGALASAFDQANESQVGGYPAKAKETGFSPAPAPSRF
jgi:hypothetical protein